jgi:hypothetical protein
MIPRPWHSDDRCGKPSIGVHEGDVRVCPDCATGLLREGFKIVVDPTGPAVVGDRFRFVYPERDRAFDCELTVVSLTGDGPDDLVFFEDHSHSKQKHLVGVIKIT